ncbi:MAG: 2OG-Fe(II) oxygenase [Hyphomicrobiaceae bacterium]
MLEPLEVANVFSPDECRQVVAVANAGQFDQSALVGGRQAGLLRRARTSWLDETTNASWIFGRMLHACAEVNRHHFDFQLEEFAERMQVSRYSAEQADFFDWHVDVGDGPTAMRRKLTIVVQLSESDSYEGGNLESNANGSVRTCSREIGAALVLPSFVLHRVSPMIKGNRFSLTLWSHGPAFR